jgi:hypothetical protein
MRVSGLETVSDWRRKATGGEAEAENAVREAREFLHEMVLRSNSTT